MSATGAGAGYGVGGLNATTVGSAEGYGNGYGNPQVLPLMGGSAGGGVVNNFAGPSGGGAILVVAGGTAIITGLITANGSGTGWSDWGGTYSGAGAIRIVANTILGNGSVSAAVVRTEANSVSPQLVISPNTVAVPPGATPIIWPPANAPTVTILSVNGTGAPADPMAAVLTSSDISISTNNPVDIILQAQNFPPSGTVSVRVTPKYSGYWSLDASYVSGDFSQSTWKATTTLPNGFCVLQAHATSP